LSLGLAIGLVFLSQGALSHASVRTGQGLGAPAAKTGELNISVTGVDVFRRCVADLKAADVQFVDLGLVARDGCTVQGAVELDAISTSFGKVSLAGRATMSCLFARRFTTWVREVAAPLTLAYTDSRLSVIETEGAFVCRTRNNRPGEKISEHAKGNAIDVASFRLENSQSIFVNVGAASPKIYGALIQTLRTTACGYFTTVLGPGSDEAHGEHLHLDYGLHGATDNFRICE
jgi:hypothetical protein